MAAVDQANQRTLTSGARLVVYATALGVATAALDIVFSLAGLAVAATVDGRYAVDVARTLALYSALGAGFGAAWWILWAALLRPSPSLGAATPAALAASWVLGSLVALRRVHGTTFLGTPDPAGPAFYAAAAILAAAVADIVWRRTIAADAAGRRHGIVFCALLIATATAAIFATRHHLALDQLLARRIEAISASDLPTGARVRPDVLLATIDTLRADRLGVYGHAEAATPALDRLGAEGVVFERAIAQSSWTRPSFGTLFTSRYPSDHEASWRLLSNAPGARRSLYNRPLRSDLPTLAELLDAAGYLTVAINTNIQTSKPFGFDHGFDVFLDVSRPLSALTASLPCRYEPLALGRLCRRFSVVSAEYPYLTAERVYAIFERLAPKLEAVSAPYFLWIHWMDPHVPYRAHDGTGAKLGYDEIEAMLRDDGSAVRAGAEIERYYDRAISYVDGYVGMAIDRLSRTARRSAPLVLVTSDHGEEIVERWRPAESRPSGLGYYHRGYGHGHTLYDELLRVPLIVRFPDGAGAGTRVEEPVAHVDVMPTLLAAAGVAPTHARYRPEGIDLREALGGNHASLRTLRSEQTLYGAEVKQITRGSSKVLERSADGVRERYDLGADPGERAPIAEALSEEFTELEQALEGWIASVPPEPASDADEDEATRTIEADNALRRQLEALGYVQ